MKFNIIGDFENEVVFVNDKELRKLKRKELLEIMLSQAKLIEELENELAKTKEELNNKNIMIKEAGSIAEASMKLSGIFEKAQEVADQYLNSIRKNNEVLVMDDEIKEDNLDKDINISNECSLLHKMKKTRRRKITT